MGAYGGRRQTETYQQRRERRAGIDDPEVVLNAAARYLEMRSHSVEEVRRYLTGKGYKAELVEAAIDRLLRARLLDDEAYARNWVESRDRAHPRGEQALRRELGRKGIERELIGEVLADRAREAAGEANPDGASSADLQAAEHLLARRAPALERVADPRLRRQRAYALLARNGFDPEICRTAVARLVDRGAAEDGE